jgi:hypothetical protein
MHLARIVLGPQVCDRRFPGQARKCNRAHKVGGRLGHDDTDLGTTAHELAHQLHRLECGDSAAQSDDDTLSLKGHVPTSLAGAGPFAGAFCDVPD